MDDSCIFCKIIKGTIPSNKIFENDKVFAFLDIAPLSDNHVLVIPKHHGKKLKDIPDDFLAEIPSVLKKISLAIEKVIGKELDFNVLQNNGEHAGQVVPHVHFHLIPRIRKDDGVLPGLDFKWSPLTVSKEELAAGAEKIRSAL